MDQVLPAVGYRQWVLSFAGRMAVRLGYDQALLAKVAEAFARAVMHDMRWEVLERHGLASVEPLQAGVFTVVQRFPADLGPPQPPGQTGLTAPTDAQTIGGHDRVGASTVPELTMPAPNRAVVLFEVERYEVGVAELRSSGRSDEK